MEIRTKTVKKFTSEELVEVANFIKDFQEFPEERAQELLEWATYAPDKFLEINKWNVPVSNTDQLSSLLGDLRLFYIEAHPEKDFLNQSKLPKHLIDRFQNTVIANGIFSICSDSAKTFSKEETERVLYLLRSDFEKNRYGGLRALGASPDQSNYLQQQHALFISDYFEEVVNSTKISEAKKEISEIIPRVAAENPIAEQPIDEKKPVNENPDEEKKTFANILMENKETFEKLLKIYEAVKSITNVEFFNTAKIEKLKNLLEALEAF